MKKTRKAEKKRSPLAAQRAPAKTPKGRSAQKAKRREIAAAKLRGARAATRAARLRAASKTSPREKVSWRWHERLSQLFQAALTHGNAAVAKKFMERGASPFFGNADGTGTLLSVLAGDSVECARLVLEKMKATPSKAQETQRALSMAMMVALPMAQSSGEHARVAMTMLEFADLESPRAPVVLMAAPLAKLFGREDLIDKERRRRENLAKARAERDALLAEVKPEPGVQAADAEQKEARKPRSL
jgi:hypothetical protein